MPDFKTTVPHLPHPLFETARSELEAVYELAAAGTPSILPIVGPSRVGKTYLTQHVSENLDVTQLNHFRETRILHVVVPAIKSVSGFLAAILDGLGLGHLARSGTTAELHARVHYQLKTARVRVLVVDEIQHLGEFKDNHARRTAADILKTIFDELGIAIVIMGLPRGLDVLHKNEQLEARSQAPILLRPYHWGDQAQQNGFESLVATLCHVLDARGGAIEADYDHLVRGCYFVSAGRIGMLAKLFAPLMATPSAPLTLERLSKTFRRHFVEAHALSDPFQEVVPEDQALLRAHAAVLKHAGLTVPIETDLDMLAALES